MIQPNTIKIPSQLDRLMAQSKENRAFKHANQTPESCLAAVMKSGFALEYVDNQTPELSLAAVTQAGQALRHVKEKTPELCLVAVTQDGMALEYVDNQTPEICMVAVAQDSRAIWFVESQSPEFYADLVKLLPEIEPKLHSWQAILLSQGRIIQQVNQSILEKKPSRRSSISI